MTTKAQREWVQNNSKEESMKIKPEHYHTLVQALQSSPPPRHRPFSEADRWNWFWRSRFDNLSPTAWLYETLYQYMTDREIDVAMRYATNEIYDGVRR